MLDNFLSALFTGQVISSTSIVEADILNFRRWHRDYHSMEAKLIQIADWNCNCGCGASHLMAGMGDNADTNADKTGHKKALSMCIK